jgi:hypothetical protein
MSPHQVSSNWHYSGSGLKISNLGIAHEAGIAKVEGLLDLVSYTSVGVYQFDGYSCHQFYSPADITLFRSLSGFVYIWYVSAIGSEGHVDLNSRQRGVFTDPSNLQMITSSQTVLGRGHIIPMQEIEIPQIRYDNEGLATIDGSQRLFVTRIRSIQTYPLHDPRPLAAHLLSFRDRIQMK